MKKFLPPFCFLFCFIHLICIFVTLKKTLLLFFLSDSEVDLLVCLRSLSCCIAQVRLSLRSQTDGQTFYFRDGMLRWSAKFMVQSSMASHPGPEAAKQPQTITIPPPCLTVRIMFFYEMLCWFYAR